MQEVAKQPTIRAKCPRAKVPLPLLHNLKCWKKWWNTSWNGGMQVVQAIRLWSVWLLHAYTLYWCSIIVIVYWTSLWNAYKTIFLIQRSCLKHGYFRVPSHTNYHWSLYLKESCLLKHWLLHACTAHLHLTKKKKKFKWSWTIQFWYTHWFLHHTCRQVYTSHARYKHFK